MADEKTEEPSSQKLEKAHEEGNFPKTAEFSSALVFASVLLTLMGGGGLFLDQFRLLISLAVEIPPSGTSTHELWLKIGTIFDIFLWLIVPICLIAAVAGTVGMVAQVGIQVSFKPLSLKLENISPVTGIKKAFSLRSVLELLQMMVRAMVIGAVAWWLIRAAISLFAGAGYQTLPVLGEITWKLVAKLLQSALLCLLIMSGADYAVQRWHFIKGQRMSKDEVKREYEESEGDPIIKTARTELAREAAESGPRGGGRGAGVESARVILTNPTHYAVALAYEPGVYDVPVVVARGADDEAREIREQAGALGIPIFSNPPLTRALYLTPVNSTIPREFYGVIAAVLVWLQKIDQVGEAPGAPPPGMRSLP